MSSVNLEAHQNVLSTINELKSNHASLNEEVLRIRLNQSRTYDLLAEIRKQKIKDIKILHDSIHKVLGNRSINTLEAYESYDKRFKEMIPNLEKFTSANAILRNSMDYFVYTLRELIEILRAEGYIVIDSYRVSDLEKLLIHVIELNQGIEQHSYEKLDKEKDILVNMINSIELTDDYKYKSLPQHLHIIYQQVASINTSMERILSIQYGELISAISNSYLHEYSKFLKRQAVYQNLFYLTVFLFLMHLLYNFYHLISRTDELVVEKNKLKSEVAETLEEVKKSNEQLREEIKNRKKIEGRLREAAIVYEHSIEGIIICDKDTKIISVNRAFIEMSGFSEKQILGNKPSMFKSGKHDDLFYKKMWQSINTNGYWKGEIIDKNGSGYDRYKHMTIIALKNEKNEAYRYIGIFMDISQQKKDEEVILYQANYDELTDLPNRNLFNDRLVKAIQTSDRHKDKVALMFIDLDNFKMVNDTYGHAAGDQLLVEIANRLQATVRKSDTVARLGGDEFVIILQDLNGFQELEVIASKLIHNLSEKINIEKHEVFTSISIGVTVYPDDARDMSELLKNADMAMYQAKSDGKNTFRFFQKDMNKKLTRYIDIENRLRNAIENKELYLNYQPIIDLAINKASSVEVLMRWHNNELGNITPDEFIPISEETGLIVRQGEWVLNKACSQFNKLNSMNEDLVSIKINVSARQLRDKNFNSVLASVVEKTGVDYQSIYIEITESIFIEDQDSAIFRELELLHSMGVRIALDDFGTGYSSLSYLKRFPVDILKIDRSFIRDIMTDDGDKGVVKAIINMAKSLDIKVVAEGVETKDQLDFIRQHGCDYAQGYYFCRPIAIDELEIYLKQSNSNIISLVS